MENDIFNKIKDKKDEFTLQPPARVWNKLAFDLEKNEFRKKESFFRRVFAISTIAAMLVIFIFISKMVTSSQKDVSVMENSDLIIEQENIRNIKSYNVHMLIDQYGKNKQLKDYEINSDIRVNKT